MKTASYFSELGLSTDLVAHIESLGFLSPTEIQRQAIPEFMNGSRDILGIARTGTGKTASFALPIIEQISPSSQATQALILVPTRELAKQIEGEFKRLKGKRPLSTTAIYGGSSYDTQIRALKSGTQVVVGTPGRLIDLLDRKYLRLENLSHIVLDEADDMLNMGFKEDIEKILTFAPQKRRMLLFSATMPTKIRQIVGQFMHDRLEINVHSSEQTPSLTKQIYYDVFARDKFEVLRRIIHMNPDFYGIVFCRTKVEADEVNAQLLHTGHQSEALHGDITQAHREKILKKFRDGHIKLLVATDVAARGVDIDSLTHVVNFSLPIQAELYVHRIGRTGRAGKSGIAISLVSPAERRQLSNIRHFTKCDPVRESIPSFKHIVRIQKAHVQNVVKDMIQNSLPNQNSSSDEDLFDRMAEGVLTDTAPQQVVASLIRHIFAESIAKKSSYLDLESPPEERRGERSSQQGRRSNHRRSSSSAQGSASGKRRFHGESTSSKKSVRPANKSFSKNQISDY